jgi:antitoxin component YwqK of YwqJK toxin-antitoxin module
LERQVRYHLKVLSEGQKAYSKIRPLLKSPDTTLSQKALLGQAPDYLKENGLLVIDEPELNLHLEDTFHPQKAPQELYASLGQGGQATAIVGEKGGKAHGQTLYFYPSGRVRIESNYEEGALHGPWLYFAESGNILVRSWFVKGQRQGRSCYYYDDGQLYSVQTYRHGVSHGHWLYYYPDGTLKTEQHYVDGCLHGNVRLYYPSGLIKKELHFKEGKLEHQFP